MMSRSKGPILGSMLLALMASAVLEAQGPAAGPSLCDPELQGSSQSPMAYRLRDGRCEGIYALQVNSTQVRLVSFVESLEYDLADNADLKVAWHRPDGDRVVRLRARSLRSKTYYRMDTAIPAPDRSYDWSSDVLASLDLASGELGVLGWTELELREGMPRTVYLPLTISQAPSPGTTDGYQVAVVPDLRLREVFISLAPVDERGAAGTPVFAKRKLDYGYYPAKEATVFELGKPEKPGLYELTIDCAFMGTGSATTSFWFYHPNATDREEEKGQ